MKKLLKVKKSIAIFAMLAFVFGLTSMSTFSANATAVSPNWNTTGSYVISVNYQSTDYTHDLILTQDASGNLDGNGGSPAGANTYTWDITGGSVVGDAINFDADYTATPDAVTPQTVMHVVGVIASDGTMSGTWSDNYQAGDRSGTWSSTTGNATAIPSLLPGSMHAEDFGVVSYDTGLGMLKGYSAGFGLSDATFAGVQKVVVKLYAGPTLLQTNTATAKVGTDITGAQISSPFDVSGTFDYAADGFWTNVRGTNYAKHVAPTRVVAYATLANGKEVMAENSNLTGDPKTIYLTPPTDGSIGGDVTGGQNAGELGVTSVEVVDSSATADGTFTNGWKYIFDITIPTNETHLAMKFSDWKLTGGSSTIAVANNTRISSAQANNSNATVMITAANTYSSPTLNMVTDLDSTLDGIQVKVLVESAIPLNSTNGSYTTNYGIKTQ